MNKITIGTRGSKLSLVQTEIVEKLLRQILPSIKIEVKVITTKGDRNMSPVPLDSVGKGWFTKEIDRELINGTIDIAVHSLKDLPEELPKELVIAAIPKREDAREALVATNNLTFNQLPKGAIIGTDSTRRQAQILHKRPDLRVESVRGNVLTRLEKLDNGLYDALFLAVAGLKRLGLESRISEYFEASDIIPSPGQGALAVVAKRENKKLVSTLQMLNDNMTVTAVHAERTFSKVVGGGCKMPVGAYAKVKDEKIKMYGVIASTDGKYLEKSTSEGPQTEAAILASKLATTLLQASKPWYQLKDESSEKYIIITRPGGVSKQLQTKIEAMGLQTFLYPAIKIKKNTLTPPQREQLRNIQTFDWILFTSKNGVIYLIDALAKLHIPKSIFASKKIGAVGIKTKEALENNNIQINFIPSEFTTYALGKEIKNIKGKKILLPRSTIAGTTLTRLLREKGADVTNIPIYRTDFVDGENGKLLSLVEKNQVKVITFTSPSTVKGFVDNIPNGMREKVFAIPVLSIGPVTTDASKKYGFTRIITADTHTTEGMIIKLSQSNL